MHWLLLALALLAFSGPLIVTHGDIWEFDGLLRFVVWTVGCWPAALILTFWAVCEWLRS